MQRFCNKTKGAVSIFLVIILVPMLTVSSVFIDMSRVKLARAVASSAGDSTLNTAMTQYDSKLKEMYGLMATSQNVDDLLSKLDTYYKESIVSSGVSDANADIYSRQLIGSLTGLAEDSSTSDFLNIKLDESDFSAQRVDGANLGDPALFKAQIVNFMKYRAPISAGLGLLSSLKGFTNLGKETKLVEKRTEYYKAEGTVMDNCKKAWDHINSYNTNDINTTDDYFGKMKQSFSDNMDTTANPVSFKKQFNDIHTKVVTDLFKGTDAVFTVDPFKNISGFVLKKADPKYPLVQYDSGQAENTNYAWFYLTSAQNVYDNSGNLRSSYEGKNYTIDPEDDSLSNYPDFTDVEEAIKDAVKARDALAGFVPPPTFQNTDYGLRYFVNYARNYKNYTIFAKDLVNKMQILEHRYRWIPADSNHEKCLLDDDVTVNGNTKTIDDWYTQDLMNNNSSNNIKQWLSKYKVFADNLAILYPNAKALANSSATFTDVGEIYNGVDDGDGVNVVDVVKGVNEYKTDLDSAITSLKDAVTDLDEVVKKIKNLADQKGYWSDSANELDSSSAMATQDKGEIESLGKQFDSAEVTKLITRITAIKACLVTLKSSIDGFLYQGTKIVDITDYNKFIAALDSKIDEVNIPINTISLGNYSEANFVFLLGNMDFNWTSNPDSNPSLRVNKLNFYTYLYTNFNTAGRDVTKSLDDPSNPINDVYNNKVKEPDTNESGKEATNKTALENAGTLNDTPGTTPSSNQIKDLPDLPSGTSHNDPSRSDDTGSKIDNTKNDDGSETTGAAGKASGSLTSLFSGLNLSTLGTGLRDNIYMTEYIMNMFSYDTIDKEFRLKDPAPAAEAFPQTLTKKDINSINNFAYGSEVEYILYGGSNNANVAKAYALIYTVRFGLNTVYAFTDGTIRSMAFAVATPISAATCGVIPVFLIQGAIIIGLALAESALDLVELKQGKEVPLYKSKKTWRLSLDGLFNSLKGAAGEVLSYASDTIIETAEGKLNGFLDKSGKELQDYAKTNMSDIEAQLRSGYDEVITEQADLVMQKLSTSVKSYIEQAKSEVVGDGDIATKVNTELTAWKSKSGLTGIAKTASDAAVDVIVSNNYAQELVNAMSKNGTDIIDGAADEVNKVMNKVKEKIFNVVNDAEGAVYKYIDSGIKNVKESVSQGADKLKSSIDSQIKGIFGSSSTSTATSPTSASSLFNFTYSDYLRVFLIVGMIGSGDKILKQTADVIQANMSNNDQHKFYEAGFRMKKASCYIRINATITVKPLFMTLPLMADSTKDVTGSGQNWYVVNYKGYKGY